MIVFDRSSWAVDRPRPVLQFGVREDGTLEVLSDWLPVVTFSDEILARADGRRLIVRGDERESRCVNGSATYALTRDRGEKTFTGRLLRSEGGPRC